MATDQRKATLKKRDGKPENLPGKEHRLLRDKRKENIVEKITHKSL